MANKRKKTRTDVYITCVCGAKAMIYEVAENRWYSHCASCGCVAFINSSQVFDRVRLGGPLCIHHDVQLKPCKYGMTSWCPICRTRVFVPPASGGVGTSAS